MAELQNSATFTVKQKFEGKYATKRNLLILGWLIVIGAYCAVCVISRITMILCFVPILAWMLYHFTWPLVSVEHEYTIAGGEMTFSDVSGKKKTKKLSFRTRDIEKVAPLTEEYKEFHTDAAIAEKHDFRGNTKSADSYFALVKGEGGKKMLVLFEAAGKTLAVLRYYNSAATVVTEVSR